MHDVKEKPKMVERAMLIGITLPPDSDTQTRSLLDELRELVTTLGIELCHERLVPVRKPHAKFLVGSGKAEELIKEAQERNCDVIVIDNELTPAQERNWEKAANDKILVIDRQEVILDIFGKRAQTKEAVLQVELARLEYSLPRLKSAWTHLSRQRGGGSMQRDAGETQLELDQRMVRTQISRVKRELEGVIQHREVQRKKRMTVPVPTCAIVGYTNAGKSSLLNKLTNSNILAEDKLFATLDPTSRRCLLPNGQPMVVTDTVGFVRNLPHRLVDAFKATLEEAVISNFLIHVLDVNSPEFEAHAETTLKVLNELGAGDKKIITVFNKVDDLWDESTRNGLIFQFPDAHFISAKTGEGLPELLQKMEAIVESEFKQLRLLIPHERYDLVARIHREGGVRKEEARDEGTYLVGSIPDRLLSSIQPYILKTEES
ncbi:MAG: GTPase HflX [Opitutales bacterium]|nr:GTPase HflX [Opitutales bacterium]MDP4645190.1 GTPase HflX [Opitutales bacterium]MDP4693213.1 GTPase HflX [Opitutales bacterium]MDP4778477.1 GTPase HflX [Opitutales bacterium]MDP4879515.1 GTPase HflX [Opitutales bacterium]